MQGVAFGEEGLMNESTLLKLFVLSLSKIIKSVYVYMLSFFIILPSQLNVHLCLFLS